MSLQKFNDRVDGVQIGRLDRQHLSGFTGQLIFACAHLVKQGLESRSTKEPEHHLDADVGLGGLNPSATEKPREAGGGGVGSVQLSEWRDEEQNGASHGLDIPYCLSGMLRDIHSEGWFSCRREGLVIS